MLAVSRGRVQRGGKSESPLSGVSLVPFCTSRKERPRQGGQHRKQKSLLLRRKSSATISDGERPPAGPFLNDQKGAKESVKEGDFDFPLLDNPPLKTTNTGGLRPPYWMYLPEFFYRCAICTVGLLRNAAGARGGWWTAGGWMIAAPTTPL